MSTTNTAIAQGINTFDWLVLFLYSLILVGIALYHSEKCGPRRTIFWPAVR